MYVYVYLAVSQDVDDLNTGFRNGIIGGSLHAGKYPGNVTQWWNLDSMNSN